MNRTISCLIFLCSFTVSYATETETSPAKKLTYTQIYVTAPDTVRLGIPFEVQFRLADREGKTVVQDDLIQVSANKLGIVFPAYKGVPIKDGIGKIWVKSSTWAGQGLLIDAKRRMYDNVFVDGRSDSIVVLPSASLPSEATPAKSSVYQIYVTAPDTVRLGTPFEVHFRLADREGKTVVQDDLIQLSANKLGVILSAVPIKDGIGKTWVESSTWAGQGLLIDAKRRMYDNVFVDGRSDSIVVLPAE